MTLSIPAFSKWLVGDTQANYMLEVDPEELFEIEEPLVATVESAPAKEFPSRVRVSRADFDFTTGVGITLGTDPIQTNPSVLISWSDDGGYSFSNPWTRYLGKQAITDQRVTVINTGLSGPMGRRWRVQVSDPVHFGLLGGNMDAELRDH